MIRPSTNGAFNTNPISIPYIFCAFRLILLLRVISCAAELLADNLDVSRELIMVEHCLRQLSRLDCLSLYFYASSIRSDGRKVLLAMLKRFSTDFLIKGQPETIQV